MSTTNSLGIAKRLQQRGTSLIKSAKEGEHLASYQGWIYACRYPGLNKLVPKDEVDEMACTTHVRRYFVDIFEPRDSQITEKSIHCVALRRKISLCWPRRWQ